MKNLILFLFSICIFACIVKKPIQKPEDAKSIVVTDSIKSVVDSVSLSDLFEIFKNDFKPQDTIILHGDILSPETIKKIPITHKEHKLTTIITYTVVDRTEINAQEKIIDGLNDQIEINAHKPAKEVYRHYWYNNLSYALNLLLFIICGGFFVWVTFKK